MTKTFIDRLEAYEKKYITFVIFDDVVTMIGCREEK